MTTASVTQHPIHEIVQRVLALESDHRLYTPEVSADEVTAYARDKTFVAIKLVQSYLAQLDPLAVSVWGLSQMQAAVQGIFNELSNFLSNSSNGHLHNAGAQTDQALYPLMWVFAARRKDDSLKPTELAIAKLSESAAATFRQLVAQKKQLETDVEALTAHIYEQTQRLETMSTTIATQKADAATVTAVVQTAYLKEEADRATAFNANERAMRDEFDTARKAMAEIASAALSSLEKSKEDASQLVGVVGNIGVTGNYQQIANKEGEAAGKWRFVTLCFFGGGIVLAIATFVEFWKEPISASNVWAIGIRLLYAIALASPAWYTAKESARHRTNSDRARQRELELASLGPFIELLPKDKKEEIRAKMTDVYFGKEVEEHVNGSPLDGKDLKEVIIELIKANKK
jgi:hypothetical protein